MPPIGFLERCRHRFPDASRLPFSDKTTGIVQAGGTSIYQGKEEATTQRSSARISLSRYFSRSFPAQGYDEFVRLDAYENTLNTGTQLSPRHSKLRRIDPVGYRWSGSRVGLDPQSHGHRADCDCSRSRPVGTARCDALEEGKEFLPQADTRSDVPASVAGLMEIVEGAAASPLGSPCRENSKLVHLSSYTLLGLISGSVETARPEAEQGTLCGEEVSLAVILDEAIQSVRLSQREPEHKLRNCLQTGRASRCWSGCYF